MTERPIDLDAQLAEAAAAVAAGEAIVYPTETVYGLGADATDPSAVEHVFSMKARSRHKPLSVAVSAVEHVQSVARPSSRAQRFMDAFLPGPVTVVVERQPSLPDALTAGGDRVGIRVPDHVLARSLLHRTPPLTATSANRSGHPAARTVSAIHRSVVENAAVVLDDGETPGGASTVVDVDHGIVHRRGAFADDIEAWLDADQDDSP